MSSWRHCNIHTWHHLAAYVYATYSAHPTIRQPIQYCQLLLCPVLAKITLNISICCYWTEIVDNLWEHRRLVYCIKLICYCKKMAWHLLPLTAKLSFWAQAFTMWWELFFFLLICTDNTTTSWYLNVSPTNITMQCCWLATYICRCYCNCLGASCHLI